MTFFVFIWVLSFAILVTLTGYAYFVTRTASRAHRNHVIPEDFHTFIHEALSHLVGGVSNVAQSAKPHTDRAISHVVRAGKWSHDKFLDRVFGRTELNRGKTASFFLKYIAEHKEEHRGTPEQRAGY